VKKLFIVLDEALTGHLLWLIKPHEQDPE